MVEDSELLWFPSSLGSLTLKPAAVRDLYLIPVVSEASRGRILNTNQILKKLRTMFCHISEKKKSFSGFVPVGPAKTFFNCSFFRGRDNIYLLEIK